VQSEGFYVNEKSTDTSWDQTSEVWVYAFHKRKNKLSHLVYLLVLAVENHILEIRSGGRLIGRHCDSSARPCLWIGFTTEF